MLKKGRPEEDLFTKLRRHLPPGLDFDPTQHWLIQRQVRVALTTMRAPLIPRITHEGRTTHPVRLLMEHDQRGKLHRYQHIIRNTCGFETCINPRHWQVKPTRKPIMDESGQPALTRQGKKVYLADAKPWDIPVFSWEQQDEPVPVYPVEDILDDLEFELERIPNWKAKTNEEIHALLDYPAYTLEMIQQRRLQ